MGLVIIGCGKFIFISGLSQVLGCVWFGEFIYFIINNVKMISILFCLLIMDVFFLVWVVLKVLIKRW